MNYAMFCLFRPLEEYVCPSILNVGALNFVALLGCYVKILFGSHLPFVKHDVSTMIWFSEFYYSV
jgi:hypothetical protein